MKRAVLLIFLLIFSFNIYSKDIEHKIYLDKSNYKISDIVSVIYELTIPKGFKVYADKSKTFLKVKNSSSIDLIENTIYPEPIIEFDKTFQKDKKLYKNSAKIIQKIKIVDKGKISLEYGVWGCSQDSCFMPETFKKEIPIKFEENKVSLNKIDFSTITSTKDENKLVATKDVKTVATKNVETVATKSENKESNKADISLTNLSGKGLKALLNKYGFLVTLLIVYIVGILTSFTPCIYPMIPITLSIIGAKKENTSMLKGFSLSLLYVLGIALSYTVLGLIASATGAIFGQQIMTNPWVIGFIVIIFLLLAFSMFDFFMIQIPASLNNKLSNVKGKGVFGIILIGAITGLVASPCAAPPLIAILTIVTALGSYVKGAALLFVYAYGLGTLLIIVGTFSGYINSIPRSGNWMNTVKYIFGFLMIAAAIYFASFILAASTLNYIWMIFLVITAVYSGAFSKIDKESNKMDKFFKAIGIILFLFAISFFLKTQNISLGSVASKSQVKSVANNYIKPETFLDSKTFDKPVLVDFWAPWCSVCKKLEKEVLKSKEIKAILEKDYYLVKVNVDNYKELLKKYKLKGKAIPILLILDKNHNTKFTHFGYIEKSNLKEKLLGNIN